MTTAQAIDNLARQTEYPTTYSLWLLHGLVAALRPNLIVEFGTMYACSTIAMALGCKTAKIITVDNASFRSDSHSIAQQNLLEYGVADRVTRIEGDSGSVNFQETVGFVFFDGAHTEHGLLAEWRSVQPHLADQHTLVFDDLDITGVLLAVQGITQNYESFVDIPFHHGVRILRS